MGYVAGKTMRWAEPSPIAFVPALDQAVSSRPCLAGQVSADRDVALYDTRKHELVECPWSVGQGVAKETRKGRIMGIMRTKSIEQSIRDTEEPEFQLRKALGPLDLTLFGIGVILGTGLFVLTGEAAAGYAGPAVALSYVVGGIVCALAALYYAAFSLRETGIEAAWTVGSLVICASVLVHGVSATPLTKLYGRLSQAG